MSTIQMLRTLVHQRLAAAAEEILGLFERAITEHEEELSPLQQKNVGQCRIPRVVLNPEVRLHQADIQQLLVQQEWSPSLDQGKPEPTHSKEEHGELSQKEEQLQCPEKADNAKFSYVVVFVKSENDEGKAQSSQLHQGPTEESREVEPLSSSSTEQTKTEARNLDPGSVLLPGRDAESSDLSEPKTEVRESDWREAVEPQTDLNPPENNEVCVSDVGGKTGKKPFSCSQCGATYKYKGYLKKHMTIHTEKRLYNCSVCGKNFNRRGNLSSHMRIHRDVKPYVCSFCGKECYQRDDLRKHTRIHTGEKPYVCSFCGKACSINSNLKKHMRVHMKHNLNQAVKLFNVEKNKTHTKEKTLRVV